MLRIFLRLLCDLGRSPIATIWTVIYIGGFVCEKSRPRWWVFLEHSEGVALLAVSYTNPRYLGTALGPPPAWFKAYTGRRVKVPGARADSKGVG